MVEGKDLSPNGVCSDIHQRLRDTLIDYLYTLSRDTETWPTDDYVSGNVMTALLHRHIVYTDKARHGAAVAVATAFLSRHGWPNLPDRDQEEE